MSPIRAEIPSTFNITINQLVPNNAHLESPIVFLMGIHDLYEMEPSIRLSEEERGEIVRDNTRKLYMACTRAGQRLVITYVGPLPDILSQQFPN